MFNKTSKQFFLLQLTYTLLDIVLEELFPELLQGDSDTDSPIWDQFR